MSLVVLLSALLLASHADSKPEMPPAAVKEAVDAYLKAVEAKDIKAMTALAGTPWLDRDRKVISDRDGLAKAVERVAGQLPKKKGEWKVEAFAYKKMRERLSKEERKPLDDVLGDDGWLVTMEEDGRLLSVRTVLVRLTGGKGVVVGGPLKENQLTQHNRIPEAVEKLLDKAEGFTLYSLDPNQQRDKDGKLVEPKEGFHGYRVLGKTEVKADADRKKLTDALRLGVEDNFGVVAGCFIPRHGVRLTADKKTVDLVICFECMSVQVSIDGKTADGFLVTGEPRATFDAVLKAAGVKLPEQAKE